MEMANKNLQDHLPELIITAKRVRVFYDGSFIADSRRVLLLRGRPTVYFFPKADVRGEVLEASSKTGHCPHKGEMRYWNVGSGEARCENAAWSCPDTTIDGVSLSGFIAFDWDAMDAWFEEDEEVFVHPRDPFTRIDVLQGSQHVQVMLDGVIVADSQRPVILYETGLPTRYYLQKPDVRLDLLVASDTTTHCPYKGEAHYFSAVYGDNIAEDLFWYYPFPTAEVAGIAGLLSFYTERAGEVLIDGSPLS
jgi:uncharacterized protein (DUF427 family)